MKGRGSVRGGYHVDVGVRVLECHLELVAWRMGTGVSGCISNYIIREFRGGRDCFLSELRK